MRIRADEVERAIARALMAAGAEGDEDLDDEIIEVDVELDEAVAEPGDPAGPNPFMDPDAVEALWPLIDGWQDEETEIALGSCEIEILDDADGPAIDAPDAKQHDVVSPPVRDDRSSVAPPSRSPREAAPRQTVLPPAPAASAPKIPPAGTPSHPGERVPAAVLAEAPAPPDPPVRAPEPPRKPTAQLAEPPASWAHMPDDWVPMAPSPAARLVRAEPTGRRSSLAPIVRAASRRARLAAGRSAGPTRLRWLGAALLVALTATVTWQLLPRRGALQIALREPAPPPTAARPAAQGLTVRAAQPGVRLQIDGAPRGTLPVRLTDLATGEHALRFDAGPQYELLERRVTVRAGEIRDLGTVSLTFRRGRLLITLSTAGARVLLGRKGKVASQRDVRGPWPKSLLLAPDDYDLVAAKPGYLPRAWPVSLSARHPSQHVAVALSADPDAVYDDGYQD